MLNLVTAKIFKFIGLAAIIMPIGGAIAEDLSITQLSSMKQSARTLGKYLGVMDACETAVSSSDQYLQLFALSVSAEKARSGSKSEQISSDAVKGAIISAMEKSEYSAGSLSVIDDVIEQVRMEVEGQALQQFTLNSRDLGNAMRSKNDVGLCVEVWEQSSKFVDASGLTGDVIKDLEIMAGYSSVK